VLLPVTAAGLAFLLFSGLLTRNGTAVRAALLLAAVLAVSLAALLIRGRKNREQPPPGSCRKVPAALCDQARESRTEDPAGRSGGEEESRQVSTGQGYPQGTPEERQTELLEEPAGTAVLSHMLVSALPQEYPSLAVLHYPFVIGKKVSSCDGVVACPTVSRIHARLEREQEEIFLVDCRSTNGTWLNGSKLEAEQRCRLKPGDQIILAEKKFIFR